MRSTTPLSLNEIRVRATASGREKPSLADLYNPLAMGPLLLKAHAVLGKAVDAAFRNAGYLKATGTPSDTERLAALFAAYEALTTANQLPLPKSKSRRQTSKKEYS